MDIPNEPLKLNDTIAIWAEMNELAAKHKCLSLGEGAPQYPPAFFLRDFMIKAIDSGANQYCRTFGHPVIIEEIAKRYGPKLGREIDPKTEILVTSGANGALSSFILGLVNSGDEVVTFEPAFPMYFDHMTMSGGTLKTVPLEVNEKGEWVFDPEKLRQALTPKTRCLILNTPHNPTGKCFSLEEQQIITEILADFPRCLVISDEVYDFLTFDGLMHVPFATIGDNWKKTVTIYSGGKLLNATGWKVGWAIGPKELIRLGGIINNTTVYCTNHPGQVAVAQSLEMLESEETVTQEDRQMLKELGYQQLNYVSLQRHRFQSVRDYLFKEIDEMDLPWKPLPCHSGYFMMVDVQACRHLVPTDYFTNHNYESGISIQKLAMPGSVSEEHPEGTVPLDLAFSRWMGKENGVTMMPNSFFYTFGSKYLNENYVRVAICKNMASVRQVVEILKKIKV